MAINLKAPVKAPVSGIADRLRPGPKAGRSYGLGIPVKGGTRRQLAVTMPIELLEQLNAVAERTGVPRGTVITTAIRSLLEGPHPTFGTPAPEAVPRSRKKN